MNKVDESRLESILKTFEQKLAKSKDVNEQRQSEEVVFYTEFKRIRTQVIRPAMEDIGTQLRAKGHNSEISEVGDEGSNRDAKITMSITIGGVPSSVYAPENTVSISFSHTSHTTISMHASTPVQNRREFAGLRGSYTASEITSDVVEEKILEVLEEVFSPS